MKISVEVTKAEMEEMCCSSVSEFEKQFRVQLDEAVFDSDGNAGEDWMVEYDLRVTVTE